ncbi:MAG TPA: hypothetical protein VLB76_06285 [Thermoanaerobaculia bacterium]|jgi:hypothetical protein|nr:hypothetical protein [Thermoanaerobaculia bacterium]
MTNYPLLFGRREKVEGNGFIARVAVSGRVLLTDEDGEFWVEGVNPGGLAATGNSASEALAQFCQDFLAVLFDIASEAEDFDHFRDQVGKFFSETSAPALEDWEEAVRQVRAGQVDADWLTKKSAETRLGVEVTLFSQPAATNNDLGDLALAA